MPITEDSRFRHLRRKIAAFLLVALALVAAVVILIGREQDLFSRKYELGITVEKGTGFTRGMPVKLSGFRIGRVKSIALNESAKVDVLLQIDSRYQKWIRRDSRAKLVKEGLVGDMVVDVSVGTPAQAVLEDKERLGFEKTKGLDELADEVAGKVRPVLVQLGDIIEYVNDPQGELKQAIRNMNRLAANLDGTRRRADDLLVAGRRAVVDSSGRAQVALDAVGTRLEEAGPLIERLNHSASLLDQRLPTLLDKVDGTVGNLLEISRAGNAAAVRVFPQVPVLVDKTGDALDRSNRLLEGVSGMWPIRSAVPPVKEERLIPGDSHE